MSRKKMTYDDLNELTHKVAGAIDKAAKVEVDLYQINDMLSALLQDHGIEFVEEAPRRSRK
jgi:hypothetical protein